MRDPTYDAVVLQKFARRLYAAARGIVFQWTVGLCVVFGGIAYGATRTHIISATAPAAVVDGAGLLGALLGLVIGLDRALALRAQAQIAVAIQNIQAHIRGH